MIAETMIPEAPSTIAPASRASLPQSASVYCFWSKLPRASGFGSRSHRAATRFDRSGRGPHPLSFRARRRDALKREQLSLSNTTLNLRLINRKSYAGFDPLADASYTHQRHTHTVMRNSNITEGGVTDGEAASVGCLVG